MQPYDEQKHRLLVCRSYAFLPDRTKNLLTMTGKEVQRSRKEQGIYEYL